MFQNPTMLAGLAGAMLPLVLHLLTRARFRNVQWGAMMFLAPDDPVKAHLSRLKEYSLLALRMAILGLLAVALARPVLAPVGGGGDGPMCTVIVFDRSGSMGIEQNGPARFESARRAALGIVSELITSGRSDDEAGLIQTPEVPGIVPSLTTDLRRLGVSIDEVTRSNGPADMAQALKAASELLEASRASFKHLVVITDRQGANWRDSSGQFNPGWIQRPIVAGKSPIAFTLIPIGGQDVGNVAVESVQVANPPIIRDVPAEIEVRVRNYDTIPSAAIPLTIHRGNEELHRTTVSLDAGASVTIRSSVRFTEPGSYFITARLAPSGLTLDDMMEAAVEVTEPIGVLVISGDERDPSAGRLRSESDFIRAALAPFAAAGRAGPDLARVDVVTADLWPDLDRSIHQVVILANVPRIAAKQVRQLEQYVYGGGGLLVAPGNLVREEEYNSKLWRDGDGLLPARLLPPTAADGSQATTLLGLELDHPIFRFLQGRDEPIPRVVVGRYFPAQRGEQQSRVLGQYATGQPFLLENPYGRGRVMLMTTPLDADWSELPGFNIYLPLLQSCIRHLAAGMLPDRNLWVNDPIVAMVDDPVESQATVYAPGNQRITIDLLQVGDSFEARFTNTNRPGPYSVHVQTPDGLRRIYYSVQAQRDESNITNLSSEEFASLQESLGFDIVPPEPSALSQAVADARQRTELWPWLLAGVVLLTVLEVGLSRAWGATVQEAIR